MASSYPIYWPTCLDAALFFYCLSHHWVNNMSHYKAFYGCNSVLNYFLPVYLLSGTNYVDADMRLIFNKMICLQALTVNSLVRVISRESASQNAACPDLPNFQLDDLVLSYYQRPRAWSHKLATLGLDPIKKFITNTRSTPFSSRIWALWSTKSTIVSYIILSPSGKSFKRVFSGSPLKWGYCWSPCQSPWVTYLVHATSWLYVGERCSREPCHQNPGDCCALQKSPRGLI